MSSEALRVAVQEALGQPVRGLTRRPHAHASSFAIEEVDAITGDGEVVRLVVKDVAASGLLPGAADAKPAARLDPARETEVYRSILVPWALDVPVFRGSVTDSVAGHRWLLLEAVDGNPLWQSGDSAAWDAAARWLGDMHSRAVPRASGRLLRYDADYLLGRISPAVALTPPGALERVAASWRETVGRLAGWPHAFLHGDYYASNVLVEATSAGPRIRPVDWELAGLGPGLLDLAALSSGTWTADERRRLALAYHAAWHPPAGRPSAGELLDVLECARLLVAVQWLGWSERWTPPPEHAHDWLATALDAAARIGL